MSGGVSHIEKPAAQSKRAAHYGEQAEKFRELANMEEQPRARARLLEMAGQYQQLADTEPRTLAHNSAALSLQFSRARTPAAAD